MEAGVATKLVPSGRHLRESRTGEGSGTHLWAALVTGAKGARPAPGHIQLWRNVLTTSRDPEKPRETPAEAPDIFISHLAEFRI